MPSAKVNGAEIYYEEAGSGPPMILSPGGLQGVLESYQPVLAGLSHAHRVIAYDRRFGGDHSWFYDYWNNYYCNSAFDVYTSY